MLAVTFTTIILWSEIPSSVEHKSFSILLRKYKVVYTAGYSQNIFARVVPELASLAPSSNSWRPSSCSSGAHVHRQYAFWQPRCSVTSVGKGAASAHLDVNVVRRVVLREACDVYDASGLRGG